MSWARAYKCLTNSILLVKVHTKFHPDPNQDENTGWQSVCIKMGIFTNCPIILTCKPSLPNHQRLLDFISISLVSTRLYSLVSTRYSSSNSTHCSTAQLDKCFVPPHNRGGTATVYPSALLKQLLPAVTSWGRTVLQQNQQETSLWHPAVTSLCSL